jgi:hypothetical protein
VSARNRPSSSTRRWICVLAVLGAALVLPANANAAAPTCPNVERTIENDTTLVFDQNPCTGGNGTLTLSPVTTPENGTLSAPGGVPQYTPDAGFVGTDSFDYKATDETPEDSNVATVTIHVTEPAPTCEDFEVSGHHDRVLLLTNSHCTGSGLTYQADAQPQHGTLDLTATPPKYTPSATFVGTDSFTFHATDGASPDSNVATVTIHVTDQAPTCENTSTTTQQDTPVDISDLFASDDADDADWTVFFFDGDHGLTDDNATYTPNGGFVGTDHVPFYADDGALTSDDCTITITVTAKPVVQQPPPQQPIIPVTPLDTAKPVFSAAHPKQSLRNARTKGLKLTSTSDEPGTLAVTIKVDRKTARKLKLKRKAKRAVTVGTLTQAIAAGKSTVTVKLTKKARKAFKQARRVKLLITATVTDAAGNASTRSMTVTLKR